MNLVIGKLVQNISRAKDKLKKKKFLKQNSNLVRLGEFRGSVFKPPALGFPSPQRNNPQKKNKNQPKQKKKQRFVKGALGCFWGRG